MKLYKHQERALELLAEHDSFALFMEQGTGKTIPALIHVTNLLIAGDIDDCLIVAPLSTLGSWKRDLEKLSPMRQRLASKITLINYDKVWRREEYQREWDCIVLDEAHAIAHRTSKRSKCLLNLAKTAKYRYLLTGTPQSNGRLEDYYSLMSFLQPNILGSWREFTARYTIERRLPGSFVNIICGYRNQEELLSLVGDYSYRVMKRDCLDLPDKLPDELILCELKEKQKYKQALKDFIEEFDMTIGNPLTKVMKLRQISSGFVYDEYGDLHPLKCDKLARLEELIDSIEGKVVVFCEFQYSIDQISDLLNKKKLKYVALDGRQKDKTVWRSFQTDHEIKVIICQYLTANAGIDLFASSHTVYYEPNLSTTVIEQSRDRIHRIGQSQPCSYYWMLTEGTIEEDIYKRLADKTDFNKSCLEEISKKFN